MSHDINTKPITEGNWLKNLHVFAANSELVLNLRAGDDVISVIKLNPPYNLLVDLSKVSLGRG